MALLVVKTNCQGMVFLLYNSYSSYFRPLHLCGSQNPLGWNLASFWAAIQ